MNLLLLCDGMNGVIYHRIATPHLRMQLMGLANVDVCQNPHEFMDIDYKAYDLIIFSRWLGEKHYDVLKKIAQSGTKYAVDVDDYWALPRYNPAYQAYRKGIKQAIKDAMHYADAVICTTPHLQSKVFEFNRNCYIVPNCLDYEHEQWSQDKPKSYNLRIGWVGGVTHYEDLKLVNEAINRLQFDYDFEFYICGYTGGEEWDKIVKLFNNPKIVGGVNTFEYGHAYKHLDFVIAPLLNESFNNHKSELKILEASAYNLPIVVSDCYPYKYCENNLGVLFAANDKWEDRIEKMILMSEESRQGMGQLNSEYCRKHYNLEHWCRERELIYKKIINGD